MAFTLRPSVERQGVWERAAALEGRSLANWIQRVCDEAAGALRDGSGVHVSAEATALERPIPAPVPERVLLGPSWSEKTEKVPVSGGKPFKGPDWRSK